MTQYQLNIDIDDNGLQMIYASGQRITVSQTGYGTPSVAWVAFSPFESNVFTWEEEANAVYASQGPLDEGTTILMLSLARPALLGGTYTLQDGMFSQPTAGPPNSISANNQQGSPMNFGIAQSAMVNGVEVFSPACVKATAIDQTAMFTPLSIVAIYLSLVSNGTVIDIYQPNALTIELSDQKPVANIGYNDANEKFYLISQTAERRSLADVALRKRG